MVVAAVGDDAIGALAGPPGLAADRADAVNQGKKLGDVVAVAAGQRDGERNAAAVDDEDASMCRARLS